MERGFLSQKGSEGGRGVKEKNQVLDNVTAKDVVVPHVEGNVDRSTTTLIEGTVTNSPTDPNKSGLSFSGPTSYAKLVTREPSRKSVNFPTLLTLAGNGVDVAISNTWSKFGLVKSMLNSSNGLFFYKLNSKDGMYAMLENGPWFIRNNPFTLKKWDPNEYLLKEDVSSVLVWVKFHGVPMTVLSDDGYSDVATKLGIPLMLDSSYTSDTCMQSWGRSSYTREMIKFRVDVELKDTIVVFGHVLNDCPMNIILEVVKNLKNPRQAARDVQVGPKVGSKPKQVYRFVLNMINANTSGKKKQDVVLGKREESHRYPTRFKRNPNLFRKSGPVKKFNGNADVSQSASTSYGSISSSFTNEQMGVEAFELN
ncbi:reverse transcriptase domain-containing protein [Tanacetum coccineum]